MGLDPLSPVAPARVRCLLLPCGRIHSSRFSSFVDRLQRDVTVRLSDVSPNDGGIQRNMFSPLAFPTGIVIYDMSTSSPPPSHHSLIPFELYRGPLIILGIADGSEYYTKEQNLTNTSSDLRAAPHEAEHSTMGDRGLESLTDNAAWIKENYSSSLVHQVLVFDSDMPQSAMPASLVAVPTLEHSRTTTMKTIMSDLTALLLAEMTSYARSLQALPSIDTPVFGGERVEGEQNAARNASRPASQQAEVLSRSSSPTTSSSPPPTRSISKHPYRASLSGHLSSTSLSDAPAEPTSLPVASEQPRIPPVTFDDFNNLPDRPAPTPHTGQASRSARDRVLIQGFGSGSLGERARNRAKGRLGVILGSMYLLSGRWPDAIRELVESVITARASNDHVWHAKALDYILVTLLMFGWAGLDFEVPQVCYPLGEKSNHASSKSSKQTPTSSTPDLGALKSPNSVNRLVSLQNLCNLLPDLVNHILHLYVRAATFTSDQIPQLSFSESVIRFAKLLALIQASFGIMNESCLQTIVTNVRSLKRDSLPEHSEKFLSRSEIASTLFRALPNPAMEKTLEVADRLNILAGVASVLSFLDYRRKKAFILRELVSLLLPALVQSRKDSAAELGFHPAASLSSLEMDISHLGAGGNPERFERGVQALLLAICDTYGIVLESFGKSEAAVLQLNNDDVHQTESLIIHRASSQAMQRSFGSLHLKMDVLRSCISLCEALPDLQGVISFSSDLLTTLGSGIAVALDGGNAYPKLPMEDQVRLANNVFRSMGASRQLGLGCLEAEYWDEFLVREIEVLSPSISDLPTPRPKSDLLIASMKDADKTDGPFIYNPFINKTQIATQEGTLLKDKRAIFIVTVQNPYDMDLEIEWIKLDTYQSQLDVLARDIVVGPYRLQKVQLKGTPTILGQVSITGCVAKIRGCQPRQFLLFKTPWKPTEGNKVKQMGLTTVFPNKERPLSSESDSGRNLQQVGIKAPTPSILVANVIENQPVVTIDSASDSQFTLMVLEGASRTFDITLKNLSAQVVDLVLVTCADSTSELLHSAMMNKDLTPAELYEAEIAAYRRPAFQYVLDDKEENQRIDPKGSLTVRIEVFGKFGLTHGAIQISYGHLGVPRADVGERFHTRELSIPISITVSASIELVRNSILPFTGDFTRRDQQRHPLPNGNSQDSPLTQDLDSEALGSSQQIKPLFSKLDLDNKDHCLVLLDFFNSWSKPLVISLLVCQDPSTDVLEKAWKHTYTVKRTVQPRSSCRLMVLLPRFVLSHRHAPIPSINPKNKRQFVLSAGKISPEVERISRELFWYREEILKYLLAEWSEPGGSLSGKVELRNLQLTPQMIKAIKLEDIGIELSVLTPADNIFDHSVSQTGRSQFRIVADRFVTVKVRLINRLAYQIYPLLRLQPAVRDQPNNIALDLSKKIAFNGLLQRALPPLLGGESRDVLIGMVFLSAGEYEIGASIEEVRTSITEEKGPKPARPRAGTGEFGLSALVGAEGRRTWYGREPCLIDVVVSDTDELGRRDE